MDIKSKAFFEYVTKRCEEITTEDKICNELNKRIIKIEKELRKDMSENQLKKHLEYLDTISALNSRCEQLAYITGFNDRISPFQKLGAN